MHCSILVCGHMLVSPSVRRSVHQSAGYEAVGAPTGAEGLPSFVSSQSACWRAGRQTALQSPRLVDRIDRRANGATASQRRDYEAATRRSTSLRGSSSSSRRLELCLTQGVENVMKTADRTSEWGEGDTGRVSERGKEGRKAAAGKMYVAA
jgi:hypothetical protein